MSPAAALGHGSGRTEPTASGRRWVGVCCCGYRSTARTSEALAAGAVVHHVRQVLARWRAAGCPPLRGAAPLA